MSAPTAAERDAAADRYRTVGPYYVLGCLDAELTEARRRGDSLLVSSLLLAQAAIDDLIAHKETAGRVARYVVSLTADDAARVAVDLTDSEADLIRRIADTLDGTGGEYSGRLHIRSDGGADPDCAMCGGLGWQPYDGVCDCMPTTTVERRTGGVA